MSLNRLFKKQKIQTNPFRLDYKDEWDLVVISGEKRLYKKEFLASMLEGFDVEWVTEPVSENFAWHHTRITLEGKILNIWDADPISTDNMADWDVIAEKIKNADVFVQLEYKWEPFPRSIIDELINKHLSFEGIYDIRKLRGIIHRIDGPDECNRYRKAEALLNDPDEPAETKAKISRTIDGDWTAGCFALLDYKQFGLDDPQLRAYIVEMLLNSESNIKAEERQQ